MRTQLFHALAVLCPLVAGTQIAGAQETPASAVIGVAAPLSESQAILGQQVIAGVEAAIAGDSDSVTISEADTLCSAEGGTRAAERFVEEGVTLVVGFLCIEAIEAALPILTEAQIPVLDIGVRANRLTDQKDRTGYLLYRLAPRSDAEAAAIAAYLARRWNSEPLGLIEDGSIASRGLVDSVRRRLADQGLQPQTVDNYRPAEEKQFGLARRLQRTGVTRFFIAGDRPDIATIARDAAELGLDLSIVAGEGLFDEASVDVPLPEGIVAIGPRTRFPELEKANASPAEDGAEALPPQGYFGTAFVAGEIAKSAIETGSTSGSDVAAVLGDTTFETSLGQIRFDEKGDSDLDLFRVFEWRGDEFVDETGG
ncbi:branched-chain amino acid ABC transporter substrate-binding protein [Jiella marina]|uniref:branched-chain amino acid ABC transporter substrate-binding protein n=1 Tax=Jiella sp. LLJ827 TaxID=2917712 RepID=UPI002100B594|nr:branched-chain amino acid ABC transporter substrate-binding protein [Jiella sp. LLJ827]MCQ0988295.1 branched-chain amino acid ABC transporter substrate-binding protein [Jiella sp. LLJ827]